MDENNNNASAPPNHILGYTIRSHTRIYISYIIPSILAVCVYIVQFVADCAVGYQHFINHQNAFGWATISLVLITPVITFILVLSSKAQRENPRHSNRKQFFGYHVLQLILFPFFTVYRFAVRIFWSIEAIFQRDDDGERMLCLDRATECATCELYLFIQAYAQAAPQIILQIYHMLSLDLFRDFNTTTVQAICLVFSAIDLAAITTSYQRFESQRRVGRVCPWWAPQQIEDQRRILECDSRLRNECACRKRDSERTISHFPESEKIMENFKKNYNEIDEDVSSPQAHAVQVHSIDEVDNGDGDQDEDPDETTTLMHKFNSSSNATDDDKIRSNPKLNIPSASEGIQNEDEIEVLDTVPDTPPPPPPPLLRQQYSQNSTSKTPAGNKRTSGTLTQLETFKDMLLVNAQLYIKEHIPHPPKMLIQRVEEPEDLKNPPSPPGSPKSPLGDEVDFFLPRPTKVVNGIAQEDFAAKTIAFFGWIAYIIMRMLALSTFCCFYPKAFFIIMSVHGFLMLFGLCLQARFKGLLNVALLYIVLAYVYIFVLLEFRVQFKRIRLWLVFYFIITMTENITMTIIWYSREEFESWWFGFIAESITYSGLLFAATLVVYYWMLKPKDVTLIVEENSPSE